MFNYAAFATTRMRGARLAGQLHTDSYDSAVGHSPTSPDCGGNVGTNGNLDENGERRDQRHPVHAAKRSRLVRSRERADRAHAVRVLAAHPGFVELPQAVNLPAAGAAEPAATGNLTVQQPSEKLTLPPGNYGDIVRQGRAAPDRRHLQRQQPLR